MQKPPTSRPSRRASMTRRTLAGAIALAASAAGVAPALAQSTPAGEAEPEPGMWAFDDELDGRPGRGLQIDTQEGRAMVVSYVGYRANGSSLFLQASGARPAGSGAFTGTLQEFRNGPVIGGASGNGEPAATVGTIQLRFDTPTSGTVALPGETPRRISRLTYQDWWSDRFFSYDFHLTEYARSATGTTEQYRIELSRGEFRLSQQTTRSGMLCTYSGPYQRRGAGIEAEGTKICTDSTGAQQRSAFRAERFSVDNEGIFSGTLRTGDDTAYLLGTCISGIVFPGPGTSRTCGTTHFGDMVVQPGMWSFDGELDGRPGRSLQIDTQQRSSTLFVSYLGYRPDGSSMFLQGVSSNLAWAARHTFALKEYRNGPAIGGPAASGEEAATVGTAQLDFDSPTTGTITLPGEAPRRISRYRYEDHSARFDKAFDVQVYPRGNPVATSTRFDIVARDGLFRMNASSFTPYTYCEYRGTYRLAGNGVASEGTRTCFSDRGTQTSESPYRIIEMTVDRNGLLRGRIENAEGTYLAVGSCGCTATLDQPR